MSNACTVQIFHENKWHDAAFTELTDGPDSGWKAPTRFGYDANWALEHRARRDACAVSAAVPVGIDLEWHNAWPAFLIDLLPQGFGRDKLLPHLGLSVAAEAAADWRLLCAGAGSPIGNMRVKEAADWLVSNQVRLPGFTDHQVCGHDADFIEYLTQSDALMFSSGAQGEWPKAMLTRDRAGLLHLDHALPDSEAAAHYIVKFNPKNSPERTQAIFDCEAPYMEFARGLGLFVHAPLQQKHRALFIPRFDRAVTEDGLALRHGQESIASLTGRAGFEDVPPHEEVCQALHDLCSDGYFSILEYIRRDVANLALKNTDNHARNTAIQRRADGYIGLTPLFDFAPMSMHPASISRRMRWGENLETGGRPDWCAVVEWITAEVFQSAELGAKLRADLLAMVPRLEALHATLAGTTLPLANVAQVRYAVLAQMDALSRLM
ncbi:type II toxin-antitoxin system HipA family toxin [Silvimonas soli]|uniref:type II toxin-antitoxin system HipA family toxin n=1 Tax=Silvimonas soli TaxID=2980100 RepID=UPI0024B332ED|nr:HipA domain-containing protein [Silvimonas soli]